MTTYRYSYAASKLMTSVPDFIKDGRSRREALASLITFAPQLQRDQYPEEARPHLDRLKTLTGALARRVNAADGLETAIKQATDEELEEMASAFAEVVKVFLSDLAVA